MKQIPLAKPFFNFRERDLVARCLSSRWVTQGPFTEQFEKLVAHRHDVQYALAATSCTAALHISLLALGIGPADEVIVPAFTWVTSAHCVEYVGARVVFVDIDPNTFNIDPCKLKEAVTRRTRAVITVHLFGLAAPMGPILSIAKKHSLSVVEDAACAIGTTYNGRPVGGLGEIGCFSFHPRKIVTTGEGGMITTNSSSLARRIAFLRNHGAEGNPGPHSSGDRPFKMGRFRQLGFNLRLSDLQAAVGVAQMEKLDVFLKERRRLALRYWELLSDCKEFILPPVVLDSGHTYQSYVVRLAKGGFARRNQIMEYLYAHGISTRPGTHAVHRLDYYSKKYRIPAMRFPNALKCEDESIALPLYYGMTERDVSFVADILRKSVRISA